MSLFDIGIGLANLLLGNLGEDGQMIDNSVAQPAPVNTRLVVNSGGYALPEIVQDVALSTGDVAEVSITPTTHPRVYAFVETYLEQVRKNALDGSIVPTASETKTFQTQSAGPTPKTLIGDISVSVAPTATS